MNGRPLKGIRVLDLTTTVSGPICTLRLAQYGAEVIKIETRIGDILRSLGGPSPSGESSGQYLHLNQGKQAVCLDLKSNAGREAAECILASCDVFVSNMRLEALARLGLGAEQVRERHPRIIHCTITGYGPHGPYRGRPAYDSVIQGASGLAGLHMHRDGAPAYVPLLPCDHIVGEITAGAVIAALFDRMRTGSSRAIEVPMLETMAAFVLQEHLSGATFTPPVAPPGDTRLLTPGTAPVRTKDGWISITANTDDQCRRMLRVIGRSDLIDDPRFLTVADRVRHMSEWLAVRDEALAAATTATWLDAFAAQDLPAMPCHSLETLTNDAHLAAVGLLQQGEQVVEGAVRLIRSTVLFDGIVPTPNTAAAPIGEDTRRVLADCGMDATAVDALLAVGAGFDRRASETPVTRSSSGG